MPNWTSNRIEAPAEVLRKYISKNENGKEHFDFNLVIPRPIESVIEATNGKNEYCLGMRDE